MKEWWNDFKLDLIFNITMIIMSLVLMLLFILLSIYAIKELIIQIF